MPRTIARPYQKQSVRRIERRFDCRALIADEMGLGKTFQSLLLLKRNKRLMLPALVICPAPLKWNWQAEAAQHINMVAEVLEGRRSHRLNTAWGENKLFIINYEILGYWKDQLLRLDPQLIIMDEVHRIKNRNSQCTKICQEICKYSPHILALSGTPLTNHPAELWTSLNILWPEKFKSFFSFAQRYTRAEMKPWGWKYSGAKNLPELHEKLLATGMIRRTKQEVLTELPDKQISILPQRLNRAQAKEYLHAQESFVEWLAKRNVNKVGKAQKALRLVKIGYLRRLAAELKMGMVYRWIDNYLDQAGPTDKLLVFGIHKAILHPIFERYAKKSILVNSSVVGQKRHNRVLDFRRNPNKKIAILNIVAGGVGLNMPEASDVLFIELPWTPAEIDQAISRAHRMGQKRVVNVRIMVAQKTIEEKLCLLLQDKQAISDSAIDGRHGKQTTLDIFDQLEKSLIRESRIRR